MNAATRCLLVPLAALAGTVLPAATVSGQDVLIGPDRPVTHAATCTCADVPDLLNRLNMAHAAIDKFRSEIPAIRREMQVRPVVADTRVDGQDVTNYEALENSVRDAQAGVQDPDASTGVSAITHGWSCQSDYSLGDASSCLLFPLDEHERIHQRACEEHRRERGALVELRLGALPIYLIDRVNEEIAAYEAEIAEILRRLRALPADCRPNAWVGTIRASEVKRLNITQTTRVSNPRALPAVKTMDQKFNRFGAVRYRGQASTATWRSEEVTTIHETSGARISCRGGLKTPAPDRTQVNTHQVESNGIGVSAEVPLVLLNAPTEALRYTISFTLPAMSARVHSTGFNSSAGGCEDRHEPFTDAHSMHPYEASDALLVDQPKAPYATVLEGTKRFDLIPFRVQIPGVTSQHTIEVTWHLHKID